MSGIIKVGTASWADPGFVRDWYPKDLPAAERLPWYAQHFDYVELNSSFYGVPDPKTVTTWAAQTPDGFTFDIKLHKLLSRHSAEAETLPPDVRALVRVSGKRVELTPELETAVAEKFIEAATPLIESGKMGAFLLQMSPEFSPRKHRLEELDHLVEQFHGHKLAFELRNRNWMTGDQTPDVLEYCESRGLSLVMVDAPEVEHFMVMPHFEAVTSPKLAYLRLHGRDANAYLTGKTVAERFNYDYSTEELKEVAGTTQRLAEEAEEVHIVFNNNHSNLAPKAAEAFQHMIG